VVNKDEYNNYSSSIGPSSMAFTNSIKICLKTKYSVSETNGKCCGVQRQQLSVT